MRTSTHSEVLRCLQALGAALTASIDSLNFGGCGVIAGMVGTELERMQVPCEVVTPCRWPGEEPADVVRGSLDFEHRVYYRHWDANGLSRGHLAVRLQSEGKLYTWDSSGVRQGGRAFGGDRQYATAPRFGTGLTVEECVTLSSTGAGWNCMFDRSQIPTMQDMVNRYLGRMPVLAA